MLRYRFGVLPIALILIGASTAPAGGRAAFLRRIQDTNGMATAIKEWSPAIEEATSEKVESFALLALLGRMDRLWDKDDKLRPDVSRQLVARMKAVNQPTLRA